MYMYMYVRTQHNTYLILGPNLICMCVYLIQTSSDYFIINKDKREKKRW